MKFMLQFLKNLVPCILIITVNISFGQDNLANKVEGLYDAGEFDQIIILIDAEASDLENADLAFVKANSLHKLDSFDVALDYYDAALNLGFIDPDLYLNRGICRISAGLSMDAENDLWSCIEAEGDTETAQYYLAVIDYLLFDNKESIRHLDLALETNSNYFEAHFLLAANYAELGQWAKARASYSKVLEIKPEHTNTKLQLARVEIELMNYDDALSLLQNIKEDEKVEKSIVCFYLAEAYFANKDQDKACEQWRVSAELGDSDARKNMLDICEKGKTKSKRKKGKYAQF